VNRKAVSPISKTFGTQAEAIGWRTGPAAEVQVFSPRQVLAFLADPRVQAHPYFGVYPVAFDTGLRRGELLGLTPDDLHLDAAVPYLRVRRHLHQDGSTDEPKTNAAKRRVTLPTAATAAVLREALARRADPARPAHAPQLWLDHRGRPLSPGAVGKAFVRLVGAFVRSPAGVECGAPMITLHSTRHSFYVNCRRRAHRRRRRAVARAHLRGVLADHLRASDRRGGRHPGGAVRAGRGVSCAGCHGGPAAVPVWRW